MLNLEPLAAEAAATMVGADPKEAENLITKSLMVLTEQGLFAFGLFLVTRKREQDVRAANDIHRAIASLLYVAELTNEKKPDMLPEYYRQLTETRDTETEVTALQRLLLSKQLVEIALTYGRYHAKAH
ncbi:hypothetical protein PN36_14875 [Candidatus Thiomargarita nelsonii]|uniref:Uncharacterized protein n=1 Tax=Candidatus Thiomargarita nelsonii TaxID=1003181 RepID=A0A0A6PN33_9GAMM|nr:hypothetical protein PN36_14875 [Candidatus Thiomargarita nelsonii]